MLISDSNVRQLFPSIRIEIFDTKRNMILNNVKSFNIDNNELISYLYYDNHLIRAQDHQILLLLEINEFIQVRNAETKEVLIQSTSNLANDING